MHATLNKFENIPYESHNYSPRHAACKLIDNSRRFFRETSAGEINNNPTRSGGPSRSIFLFQEMLQFCGLFVIDRARTNLTIVGSSSSLLSLIIVYGERTGFFLISRVRGFGIARGTSLNFTEWIWMPLCPVACGRIATKRTGMRRRKWKETPTGYDGQVGRWKFRASMPKVRRSSAFGRKRSSGFWRLLWRRRQRQSRRVLKWRW